MSEMPQTNAEWQAVASELKVQYPEHYLAVTGLPLWWDQVGVEYRAAEAKWLQFVKRHAMASHPDDTTTTTTKGTNR